MDCPGLLLFKGREGRPGYLTMTPPDNIIEGSTNLSDQCGPAACRLFMTVAPDHEMTMHLASRSREFPLLIAAILTTGASFSALATELPPVRIAYFVPSDAEPCRDYEERLNRVMAEVQGFYREGMEAAGYGRTTFALERDDQNRLTIHTVLARHPMQNYGRNASDEVRQEVKAALAARGIDMDGDTWVIFQVLLRWDGDRATEIGPYCGGGNHRAGTAWVYDDERLDAKRLASKAAGGYYHRPCSIGQFNTHYIGGIAHEMGHAFGLPHDCERKLDRSRGRSLMGGGNHTYGQEQRGEGPGTFLSAASAMLLAHSRPFAGELEAASEIPDCRMVDMDAQYANEAIVLSGQVAARPPVFGIAAFDDWGQIPGDYDAVSWTCPVAKDGQFRLTIGELRPGESQLRLRVVHASGATTQFAFDYRVDQTGKPDIDIFRYRLPLDEVVDAYRKRDRDRAAALATALKRRFPDVVDVQRRSAHLQFLLGPRPKRPLAALSAQDGWTCISGAEFRTAQVGWGRPLYDEVLGERPGECFLQVGGRLFERGIYAHAPARHELELHGNWSRFRSSYGLQDGHDGSVVFVLRGDGRELFRSLLVRDHKVRHLEVNVGGVTVLELCVEDGGDGPRNDWGVWLAPELQQSTATRNQQETNP